MRLLDLFCGAGGCSVGYNHAGFDNITGVDINPQLHYPFKFIQSDALEYLRKHGHEYDVIHASPPCQAYSRSGMQWRKMGKKYPDLISEIRDELLKTGKIYIIENVPGAPLVNPIMLNGAKFGLLVNRKRLFECSFDIGFVMIPKEPPSRFRMGRPVTRGAMITPVGHFSNVAYAREQMQVDWMTQKELAQAIPPAYTEFIGKKILEIL
jgi:DNA (cytosine-5)-methyltransferase 1